MKRFNLLVTNRDTNEIVFDKWIYNLMVARTIYYDLCDGLDTKHYWLHIVDEDNNLIMEEKAGTR